MCFDSLHVRSGFLATCAHPCNSRGRVPRGQGFEKSSGFLIQRSVRFGQIKRSIDKGVTFAGHVGREYIDLAMAELASRSRILPTHATRRTALLEKACLIDHQDSVGFANMLDDVVTNNVAQHIGIPSSASINDPERIRSIGTRDWATVNV